MRTISCILLQSILLIAASVAQDRLAPWYCGDSYAVCLEDGTKVTDCDFDFVLGSEFGMALVQAGDVQLIVRADGTVIPLDSTIVLEGAMIYGKPIIDDSLRYAALVTVSGRGGNSVELIDLVERKVYPGLSKPVRPPHGYRWPDLKVPQVLAYHRNDSLFIFGPDGLIASGPKGELDLHGRWIVRTSASIGAVCDLKGDTMLQGSITPTSHGSCGMSSLGILSRDDRCYCILQSAEHKLTIESITCDLRWSHGDYEFLKRDDNYTITRSGENLMTLSTTPTIWIVGDTLLIAQFDSLRWRKLLGPVLIPNNFDKVFIHSKRCTAVRVDDTLHVYSIKGEYLLRTEGIKVSMREDSYWIWQRDGSTAIFDSAWQFVDRIPLDLYTSLPNESLVYEQAAKYGILDTARAFDSGARFDNVPAYLSQHWYQVRSSDGNVAYSAALDTILNAHDQYTVDAEHEWLVGEDYQDRMEWRYSLSDGALLEKIDKTPRSIKRQRYQNRRISYGKYQLVDQIEDTVVIERPFRSSYVVFLEGYPDRPLWWCNLHKYAELYDTAGRSLIPRDVFIVAMDDMQRYSTIDRIIYLIDGKYGLFDEYLQPLVLPQYSYLRRLDSLRYFARLADSTGVVIDRGGSVIDSVPYFDMYPSMSDYFVGVERTGGRMTTRIYFDPNDPDLDACEGKLVETDRSHLHWLDDELQAVDQYDFISLYRRGDYVFGSFAVDNDTITHLYRDESLVGVLPYYKRCQIVGPFITCTNTYDLENIYDVIDTMGNVLLSDVRTFRDQPWRKSSHKYYYYWYQGQTVVVDSMMTVIQTLSDEYHLEHRFASFYKYSNGTSSGYELLVDVETGDRYYDQPLAKSRNDHWYEAWKTEDDKIIACHPETMVLYAD